MDAKVDYGIDAPGWLVGSAIAGSVALVLGLVARSAALPAAGLLGHLIWPGIVLLLYAAVHLWSSKVGKRLEARRLLDTIPWRGDEQVLDVGCGRGLLLVEAAKHLNAGRAVGVDVWSAKDQWDNRPGATYANARAAGVSDRIEVEDADARHLPFADASFDVVLSSFVIHNIPGRGEQARALAEMVRVLQPGGRIAIIDIEGTRRYARTLEGAGLTDVRRSLTSPLFVPGTARVTARKPA